MPNLLGDLLFDYTIRNVALGSAILGVMGGVLGCFAVLRRQSLLGDALAHATLPGVCLAFLLTGTRSPAALLTGAVLAALAGALVILLVTNRTRIKQDAALGIVLSVFFGLGTVLLSYIGGTGEAAQSGLDRFVFGQAAAIVAGDVVAMGSITAAALLVVALLYKEFKLLAFDPAFASALGYPVGPLGVVLTALIVAAIVVGIQAVGVVLMAAMLITPAVAARQWTERLGVMLVVSGLFGAASGVAGALLSASGQNLPTGPLIVLVATGILLVSLLLGRSRGFLPSALRDRRNRRAALAAAPEGGTR